MKMSEDLSITKSLQTAYNCEAQIRSIISEQTTAGIRFNLRRANRYIQYITNKKEQLYDRIRPLLQLEVVQPYPKPVNKPFKKDGSHATLLRKGVLSLLLMVNHVDP